MTETVIGPLNMSHSAFIGGRYGLGWGVQKMRDAVYIQYDGGNEGFSCSLIAHMKTGYGAVVMTNASSAGIIPEITRAIAREYQWENYLPAPYETVVLAEEKLRHMIGRFLLGPDRAVTVSAAGGRILADVTRMSRIELVPISQTEFISLEDGTSVTFAAGVTPADDSLRIWFLLVVLLGPGRAGLAFQKNISCVIDASPQIQ
jgi:hypothetical protein